ncbi:hypothetical protein F4677DRAFT_337507 [Hypoxylon crocopeplum]|nr:hypothetical protein F4677DRAFT_337507 [Hypoxylon crocopeplum]
MSAIASPPAFTRFSSLPEHVRARIWKFSLPEDTPEVCIPWPLEEDPARFAFGQVLVNPPAVAWTKLLEPLLVDTPFPVAMHVSRESRHTAKCNTRFRYSLVAGCPVPFRAFRPDFDILYINICRPITDDDDSVYPKWGRYPKGTRHIALDLHSMRSGKHLHHLTSLAIETISCVLTDTDAPIMDVAHRFRPPTRRCRLREFDVSDYSQDIWVNPTLMWRGGEKGVRRYLDEVGRSLNKEYVENVMDKAGNFCNYIPEVMKEKWDAKKKKIKIEFFAKTFEEYRGGQWVPNSSHAVCFDYQYPITPWANGLIQRTPPYRVTEAEKLTPLRDPEKFRVNDIQQIEVPIPVDWDPKI